MFYAHPAADVILTDIADAAAAITIARPVVAAVVFTFFLVWILATAGTSDPSMLTLEGEAVVGMFSIGMDGISDLDNCAIWVRLGAGKCLRSYEPVSPFSHFSAPPRPQLSWCWVPSF